MARTPRTPTTPTQKCAAALSQLQEVNDLLKSIDLRTQPKAMREHLKEARSATNLATRETLKAMTAVVPEMPLQRAG